MHASPIFWALSVPSRWVALKRLPELPEVRGGACRAAAEVILLRDEQHAPDSSPRTFCLHSSPAASLHVSPDGIIGAKQSFALEAASLDDAAVEACFQRFPHLRGCTPLRLVAGAVGSKVLNELVTSQLCVSAVQNDLLVRVTGVQMAGLLDEQCAPAPYLHALQQHGLKVESVDMVPCSRAAHFVVPVCLLLALPQTVQANQ
jgi:hypothetical protein